MMMREMMRVLGGAVQRGFCIFGRGKLKNLPVFWVNSTNCDVYHPNFW